LLAPPEKFAGVSDNPVKFAEPPPPVLSSAITHLLDELLYFKILSLAIPVVSTSDNALIPAADILASALAFVKYKLVPSDKFLV
jgi:hypothetical protein